MKLKCKMTKHRSKISQCFDGKKFAYLRQQMKQTHTYVFQTINTIMYKF